MNGLERALRIEPDEGGQVVWLVGFFAVIQASHGVAANTADALFLQRFGIDRMPLMILVSGLAIMVLMIGHGAGLASFDTARWLQRLFPACIAWAGVEWVMAMVGWRSSYPVIWVSTQVIIMLTFIAMWNAAGAASTTRQAKRLFPIFATAGILGGVVGNVLTGPLARLVGTENLLLIQAGLLLAGLGLLSGVRRFFTDEGETGAHGSVMHQLSETIANVRSSRLLRLGAVVAAAVSCLFYLFYFSFNQQVAASFATEAQTAAFLGVFASVATATTFLVSLFVTNRLFARFGIVISLLLVPLVYVGGFTTWLFVFSLSSAVVVRGMQWVSINAVGGTAFTALFNVMPGRRRSQIVSFMTAVPAQIGTIIGGALLMVTASSSRWVLFAAGLVVALAALVSVLLLRSSYVDALVTTVRAGISGVFDTPTEGLFTPTDADAVRVFSRHLDDPRPAARALAVTELSRLRGRDSATEVQTMLDDASPRVRAAAFDSLCVIDPGSMSSHTANAMADDVPEIRLHALGYLLQHAEADDRSLGRQALSDSDPRVRAAAASLVGGEEGQAVIDGLSTDPDPAAVTAALIEGARPGVDITLDPAPFIDSDAAPVRAAAARALAVMGQGTHLVVGRLDDRSPRVRAAAATALAASVDGRRELQTVLESGSVMASEAALRALTPVETPDDRFLEWARNEALRAYRLMDYATSLESLSGSAACSYLVRVLRMRSTRLVDWTIRAMTSRRTEQVMPVVARGIRSREPEVKAQALETLETVGTRSVTEVLMPLLENRPVPESGPETTLKALVEDFDPWIKGLARRVLGEMSAGHVPSLSKMTTGDHSALFDPMDRLLSLQQVDMLSELDPEDLDLIAHAVSERHFDPGEVVYVDGEPGDEMLFIVRGEAVVTVAVGDARRVVETYGPGEPVGELALLSGQARSADVHAGEDGLVGLALSNRELLSVLEERPVVAMGMLGTLARRLIEQT